ncbi:hypothetical protein AMC99_02392 [Altererythrobacter epoxidivorans]|uniref:Uncharacterized protein n=2 Tax=Altererythrobacter epoxidivorans TaxID=361183 RepID=A0A0M4LWG7_9SPHN|nr:hypothetical protein AMC99_02392 [Altererythrobacter epoxidivorans]
MRIQRIRFYCHNIRDSEPLPPDRISVRTGSDSFCEEIAVFRKMGLASVMARNGKKAGKAVKLPLLLAGASIAFAVPSAGLAYQAFSQAAPEKVEREFGIFTPASVDPQLARRVAARAAADTMRFTPAGTGTKRDRSVTVAVRVDGVARAINVRQSIQGQAGSGEGISSLASTRYNLGVARGYQSFARPVALPNSVQKFEVPDLAKFEPAGATASGKPGRLQPRISLDEKGRAGSSAGTIEGAGSQVVDLGGSYRLLRNLDVTAGVRLSQERDRIAPLTDAVQDNQAVYVGTQFRF